MNNSDFSDFRVGLLEWCSKILAINPRFFQEFFRILHNNSGFL